MIIEKIELRHFRNYGELCLFPHEQVNIFFGPNGSGKTNLLEAVHYCSVGKSHRISQDVNAVQIGEEGALCRMTVRSGPGRQEVEVRLRPGEDSVKTVMIDRKKAGRLSEMMGVLRCVIFSPEDLALIREGPSVRRRFLDMMISQVSRPYFIALQQYRTALSQRNAILRQARAENRMPDGMIRDFEDAMADRAEVICRERIRYTEMLSEYADEVYRRVSGRDGEEFRIQYHPSVRWDGAGEFPLRKMLEEDRPEDVKQGNTSRGPQRDDLVLTLNQKNMKLYASQGQIRTGALSLKLGQLKLMERISGDAPVLLLDDVMSELDLDRRMNLLGMLEGVQTFITCADEGDLADYQQHRTVEVRNPDGRAELVIRKEGPAVEKPVLAEPVFE